MPKSKAKPNGSLLRLSPGFEVSKGEKRRTAVLNAAIEIVAEQGIHALSIEAVGRQAKMRRSHVAYYFTNPEVLLDAVIRHVVAVGQEITVRRLAEVTGAKERLLAHTAATFEWFESHPHHAQVMLLLQYYGGVREEYRELNELIRKGGEGRIGAILEAGPKSSKATKADIAKCASVIRSQLLGSLSQNFAAGRPKSLKADLRITQEAVLLMAHQIWR